MARSLLAFSELRESLRATAAQYSRKHSPIPTDDDLLSGDAYMFTAHAAVEYFFEELCRRALYASLHEYRVFGRDSFILKNVITAHYFSQVSQLPSGTLDGTRTKHDVIQDALQWHIKRIDNNNGIKANNLRALLFPFGFKESDFDPVWMNAMDSFGSGRGDMAHGRPFSPYRRPAVAIAHNVNCIVWTAKATRPRAAIAPWDVDARLQQLLPEMLAWDRRVVGLCRCR
ncbi:hypothetical protein ACWDYH_02555 [Nocardia goodfellowii]